MPKTSTFTSRHNLYLTVYKVNSLFILFFSSYIIKFKKSLTSINIVNILLTYAISINCTIFSYTIVNKIICKL